MVGDSVEKGRIGTKITAVFSLLSGKAESFGIIRIITSNKDTYL